MPSLVTKPLLAVSLAVPSLLLLGYLWQRRRAEEAECTDLARGAVDSKQVTLKLENLNRSRLDCIEEEILEEKLEEQVAATATTVEEEELEQVEPVPAEEPAASSSVKQVLVEATDCGKESAAAVNAIGPLAVCAAKEEVIKEHTLVNEETSVSEPIINQVVSDQVNVSINMTEKDNCAESGNQSQTVPDVISALQDPICSLDSSPSQEKPAVLSTSPVKSDSAESQRSSEAWSDLIEQDEREELERSVCDKLSLAGLERNDSGVASPTEEFARSEAGPKEEKLRISSGEDAGIGGSETGELSDSGHGSEHCAEDSQLLAYHFYVQDYLCGSFIGYSGNHINKLKQQCNCNIILKDDSHKANQKRHHSKSRDRRTGDGSLNLCIIEGTRNNIDKCLDLIREKFRRNPELTLEQVNKPENTNLALYNGSVTLSLAEGIMHDVFVVSIVNGAHIFVQQPAHPTFSALERLDNCMYNTYSQFTTPDLARPIATNSICVVSYSGGWYRCQVTSYDEVEDTCDIKYIDYGGYDTVPADQLKQIRTDFLTLPFQAIECYLANIVPTEEDTVSAEVLESLVAGQAVQARMIGLNEDGIPMVHLYRASNGQTVMVNRELVDRNCANWIEATIIPISPGQVIGNWNILGDSSPSIDPPYTVMQIKHFENLTNNTTMWEHPEPSPGPFPPGPYPAAAPLPLTHAAAVSGRSLSASSEVFVPPLYPPAGGCWEDYAQSMSISATGPPTTPLTPQDYAAYPSPLGTVDGGGGSFNAAAEPGLQPSLEAQSLDYSAGEFYPPSWSESGLQDVARLSPGLFLLPYQPLDLGAECPTNTYLQWSNVSDL